MALFQTLVGFEWLLLVVVGVVFGFKKYRTYNKLKAFKGPFGTGVSDFWHCRTLISPDMANIYEGVCQKYGTIARVGPNDLLTNSPEVLTHISAARSACTRGKWFYRGLRVIPGVDAIFNLIDEEQHTKQRHRMAPGYSGKENHALEASIDAQITRFIHLIRSKYACPQGPQPMDLGRKTQFLALDIITAIGLGKPYGFLEHDSDVNAYISDTEAGMQFEVLKSSLGFSGLLELPGISHLLWPSEKDKQGFGKFISTAKALITERLAITTDTHSDMLASFTRHDIHGTPLLAEVLFQLIAGSDTTSTAIRVVMLHIITNPIVYAKLQTEIDIAVANQPLSSSSSNPDIISATTVRHLPYLQAVIREGMRLSPPVAMPMPKTTPTGAGETIIVDGKPLHIPGGTNINQDAFGMHHSTAIYGPDAGTYRPERWLVDEDEDEAVEKAAEKRSSGGSSSTSKETLARMVRVNDMVFGSGRYQCLGKGIAMMEVGKTVFELMRYFEWGLVNPGRPWVSRCMMGVFIQRDMWVRVSRRELEGNLAC